MRKTLIIYLLALLSACFFSNTAFAQVEIEEKKVEMDGRHYQAGMREYGISGGYGFANNVDEFISEVTLLPKWGLIMATVDKGIKGAAEFEVEPVLGMTLNPSNAPEAGVNVLFTYNFETGTRFVPYFSAGAGFLYTDLRVHELSSRFNGSPQGGVGLKYFIKDNTAFTIQYRFRHVSNAGTAHPNHGVNSDFILFGIDFLR